MFDPDKFILTKQDFLNILNRIETRWKINFKENWRLILEMEGIKVYFKTKTDESIQKIWKEIIHEINEVIIDNSIAIDKKNENRLLDTFEKIKHGTKSEQTG